MFEINSVVLLTRSRAVQRPRCSTSDTLNVAPAYTQICPANSTPFDATLCGHYRSCASGRWQIKSSDGCARALRYTHAFKQLGLSEEVVPAWQAAGYVEPTPIQTRGIPLIPGWQKIYRRGANRHGQDRGVCPADPHAAENTRQMPLPRARADA